MALSFAFKLIKWGYEENNGPANWGQWYPVAEEGVRQSPVDIKTGEAQEDVAVQTLVATYTKASLTNLENTGKSFQVHFHDPQVSSLTGGPLEGEYKVRFSESIH